MEIRLCFIRNLFGVPCPGCGMTRAWLSALKLDFSAAMFYHPLFWLVPIIFIITLFRNKIKLCYDLYNSKLFLPGCLILFIAVYIVRMLLYFPITAPMDFNDQAIIIKLLKIFEIV